MLRFGASRLVSALVATDPGSLRLRSACRTTIATAATAAVLGVSMAHGLVAPLAVAAGTLFAMMAASLPRDVVMARRLVTVVAMMVVLAIAMVAEAALEPWPVAGRCLFLVSLFGAVAVQSWGPRAVACGFVAVMGTYLVLFLQADLAHIPTGVGSLPVAAAIVAAVGYVLLPERPDEALRRIVATVQRRSATLLHAVGSVGDELRPADRLKRRRLLADLNDIVLAAEDQIAVLDPAAGPRVSAILMQFELAILQVSVAALDAHPLGDRDRARIKLAALRLSGGKTAAPKWRGGSGSPLWLALRELDAAAAALSRIEFPGRHAGPPLRWAWPTAKPLWRPAIRAGTAALLSMLGGLAISPERWFWAVLTAYLVFLGARSRGDTIFKGVQRVWGTFIGLVVGTLVSVALSGHTYLEVGCLVVCVFALAYVFALSQTLAIFCVTVLLGLIYSLLGARAETILTLRLEETAIGALAATFVGLVLLPRRTRDLVRDNGAALLKVLADVVRLSGRRLAGHGDVDPVARMRAADRALRDLRAAIKPLQAGRSIVWWARSQAELPALLACIFWVRVLASASSTPGAAAADAADLLPQSERLASRLEHLAGTAGGGSADPASAEPRAADPPLRLAPGHLDQPRTMLVGTALANLDSLLDVMDGRFASDGWGALVSKRPI